MSVSRRALTGLLMAVLVAGCIIAMPAAAEVVSPTEPPTEIPFGGAAPNVDDNASATPPPTEIPFGGAAPNVDTTETGTPAATEAPVGEQAMTETETETPTETVTETETETPVAGAVVDNVSDDVPIQVQPGETITVGTEPQVYSFEGLRNATPGGPETEPIIELRAYDNNNPETGTLVNTVELGAVDTNVELSAADFGNTFGIYYPYDGQDVIDNSITVTEETDGAVGNETPTETMTTEETMTPEMTTETPVETPTEEMTAQPTFTTMQEETGAPTPTATPLSIPIVLAALGILGLLIVVRRNKR